MSAERVAAYKALLDIEKKDSYSNLVLNRYTEESGVKRPAFVRELTYGVLENKMLLDHILGKYVKRGIGSVKKQDLTILRMGVYQISYMDSVPERAAVNESVDLAKRFARGREGFVNGVLRSFIRDGADTDVAPPEDEDRDSIISYLSLKYSYEDWIVRLWLDTYGREFTEELLRAGNATAGLTVRVNLSKTDRESLKKGLREKGFEAEDAAQAPTALHVAGEQLLSSESYKKGLFSVQDEASQLAVDILDPQPGDTVIDVCAAPGGKSLAIAERMQGKGRVIARDIYPGRLELVKEEAARLGIDIIETEVRDGETEDLSMKEKADAVLVDAPCSGLGVIRRKPEIKYRKFSRDERPLTEIQKRILDSSAGYVKPGGRLMYCTCTINENENRKLCEDFLTRHREFEETESRQLFPNKDGTDGFYICQMKRL
jgi:16S rRNA (cytosine967-C5)-methyltransferase